MVPVNASIIMLKVSLGILRGSLYMVRVSEDSGHRLPRHGHMFAGHCHSLPRYGNRFPRHGYMAHDK
jgi:hypothetical protein